MRYSGLILPKIGDALAGGRGVLQPIGAQPERAIAGQTTTLDVLDAVLGLVLLGGLSGVDAPPARQIFADQDDADGSPNIGDTVRQGDHCRCVIGRHAGWQLDGARCHGLLGRANRRRHGLRASQHAAGRSHRKIKQLGTCHDQRQAQYARHHGQERELQPVAFQAVDEGGTHAQADAVHEQIVEQALGEIVQLELYAVYRRADRNRATDHDGSCHHAEAVALDGEPSDPDGHADHQEQQQVRILLEECEEAFHLCLPHPAILIFSAPDTADSFVAALFAPLGLAALPDSFASASGRTSFSPWLAS